MVLTFSSLERNSHIGIADPATRIVMQHPSRMQVVTFTIEVPLIIIMMLPFSAFLPFFTSRHSLHAGRCAITRAVTGAIAAVTIVVKQSITSPNLVLVHGIVLRSIVSCILSLDLVCRFVLCCLARPVATTRLQAPPLCPSIRVSVYTRHSTRGARVHGIRNVFTRTRKSR